MSLIVLSGNSAPIDLAVKLGNPVRIEFIFGGFSQFQTLNQTRTNGFFHNLIPVKWEISREIYEMVDLSTVYYDIEQKALVCHGNAEYIKKRNIAIALAALMEEYHKRKISEIAQSIAALPKRQVTRILSPNDAWKNVAAPTKTIQKTRANSRSYLTNDMRNSVSPVIHPNANNIQIGTQTTKFSQDLPADLVRDFPTNDTDNYVKNSAMNLPVDPEINGAIHKFYRYAMNNSGNPSKYLSDEFALRNLYAPKSIGSSFSQKICDRIKGGCSIFCKYNHNIQKGWLDKKFSGQFFGDLKNYHLMMNGDFCGGTTIALHYLRLSLSQYGLIRDVYQIRNFMDSQMKFLPPMFVDLRSIQPLHRQIGDAEAARLKAIWDEKSIEIIYTVFCRLRDLKKNYHYLDAAKLFST